MCFLVGNGLRSAASECNQHKDRTQQNTQLNEHCWNDPVEVINGQTNARDKSQGNHTERKQIIGTVVYFGG